MANSRNATLYVGVARETIWHYNDSRWDYYLEVTGHRVSKRYREEKLTMAKPEMSDDMGYDTERVDQAVLALLFLTSFREGDVHRAWKGHDWGTLNRLHEKGYISDPVSKAKSVVLSEDGYRQAQALFEKLFAPGGA